MGGTERETPDDGRGVWVIGDAGIFGQDAGREEERVGGEDVEDLDGEVSICGVGDAELACGEGRALGCFDELVLDIGGSPQV